MEFDSQLLQDLLEFLRTLENTALPAKVEALRVRLMGRMRTALSSGDYTNMQSGKSSKEQHIPPDNTSEEYVIPDHQPAAAQSFLYQHQLIKKSDNADSKQSVSPPPRPLIQFPPESSDPLPPPPPPSSSADADEEITQETEPADPLIAVYSSMNLLKAQSKSHHYGQLQRREKWFLFENIRPFSAVLIGSHFLSFDNKMDYKPSQILPIKGCKCRPVPVSPRNPKKLADSTFELSYGNNISYQFIATTPKEMQQWVAAIVRSENKTRDAPVHPSQIEQFPPPPAILQEEDSSTDNADENEEYTEVDPVITDIAKALATPERAPKPNLGAPPIGKLPPKPAVSPHRPTLITNRVLPPPPSSAEDSQHDEDVYQDIDGHAQSQKLTSINSSGNIRGKETSTAPIAEELYDDIDNMRREVEEIEAKKNRREIERNTPVQELNDDNDPPEYDDVGVIRKEVEEMKRNASAAAKASNEIDKEKKYTKELPTPSTKSSPKKGFNVFNMFRQKSESPLKEAPKKKPMISIPQQQGKAANSTDLSIGQNSLKSDESYANNTTLADLSDYNSPPRPRPVDGEKSFSNDNGNGEEEAIYDDVAIRKEEPDNHVVNTEAESKNRKMNENSSMKNLVRNQGGFRPALPMTNIRKNVMRNLNEKFNAEVHQNQSGDSNAEDDSEHYQVPRPDANVWQNKFISSEDANDEGEKIYDDVAIVVQKKHENIQAKAAIKPVVVTPPKFNRGPPVLAKPSDNNFLNKLNKFTLSPTEKNASDKNPQHRFNSIKKSKPHETIIPLRKYQIQPEEEQIYDDCQTK